MQILLLIKTLFVSFERFSKNTCNLDCYIIHYDGTKIFTIGDGFMPFLAANCSGFKVRSGEPQESLKVSPVKRGNNSLSLLH